MADIIDIVMQEHREVEALFDQLKAATGADHQQTLFTEVKDKLERHASAEERVLYPRIRKEVPDGKEEAEDAVEEHDQMRSSIEEVEEHEAGTELFMLAVEQLVATTRHHVGVEEQELLPDFREHSEAEERQALAERFEQAKRRGNGSGGSPEGDGATKQELYDRAREAGIVGRSSMSRKELLAALDKQS